MTSEVRRRMIKAGKKDEDGTVGKIIRLKLCITLS